MILGLAVALAACGSGVKTQVTTFQTLGKAPAGKSFMIAPALPEVEGLEYNTYAGLIASHLMQYGLRPVAEVDDADYVVFFAYTIDGGRKVVTSRPIYSEKTPRTETTKTSYVGGKAFTTTTTTQPTYEITGFYPVEHTYYGRTVVVRMVDSSQVYQQGWQGTVYEARAKSHGTSSNLAQVMPSIIKAIFIHWPAPNGSTRTHETELVQ